MFRMLLLVGLEGSTGVAPVPGYETWCESRGETAAMPAAPTAAISIGGLGYFAESVGRYGWSFTALPRFDGSLSLRDRRHHTKARTAMAAAPMTEPTPIPALALVESPLSDGLLAILLPFVGGPAPGDEVCVAGEVTNEPWMILVPWIVKVKIIVLVTWTVVLASRNEVLVTKLVDRDVT